MRLHAIRCEQVLPVSLETAWSFFGDPANLGDITPPWLRFEILSPAPPCMHPGLLIEYRITALAGIPMRWVTEITHAREPFFFVDEQRFGPYRFWHHQHHFRTVSGGVEMTDIVHYTLPLGLLGEAMHRLLIKARLQRIFAFRRDRLVELFGR